MLNVIIWITLKPIGTPIYHTSWAIASADSIAPNEYLTKIPNIHWISHGLNVPGFFALATGR
jgi:hypothetical protein